jgi:predicted TIM-barrel fold metal-dependent hydrolase
MQTTWRHGLNSAQLLFTLAGMKGHRSSLSRRQFLSSSAILAISAAAPGCKTRETSNHVEPIIDIHQHVNYQGRTDEALLAHQRTMGVTTTILLPAGRPVNSAATHEGVSNGLQAKCGGNEPCLQFAKLHSAEFRFAANEVPDLADAIPEIEKYLKLGAIGVAEQKFGVECDSVEMQRIYELAAHYHVPVLLHWQVKMYNYGFDRFYKMLEKHPRTIFIGHAQTWWANIDKNYKDDPAKLYPKGPVTPGGLTDRYLSDYPNLYGDLSAGSGLNALTRDEDHARGFFQRHQDKLIYGSDCDDLVGTGPGCQGAQTIAAVRRLAANKKIERKLLHENARRVFKV